MSRQNFDKTLRIPVITDLVIPGDPELKKQSKQQQGMAGEQEAFEHRLKQKIDELKSNIGQDESDNIARAHAIRSEAGNKESEMDSHHSRTEQQIDQERKKTIKELKKEKTDK